MEAPIQNNLKSDSGCTVVFRALFDSIEGAQVIEAKDVEISLQGLSDREVVIAYVGVDGDTAVVVRHLFFVQIMNKWFEARMDALQCNEDGINQKEWVSEEMSK